MVLLGREPEPEVEALSKLDLDTPGARGAGAGAWRKNGRSGLVYNHLRSVSGTSLIEVCCGGLRDVFLNIITIIVAIVAGQLRKQLAPPQVNTTLLDPITGAGAEGHAPKEIPESFPASLKDSTKLVGNL
ncbi:hypothetical protein Tco_0644156 [Tanacetum coccineum]